MIKCSNSTTIDFFKAKKVFITGHTGFVGSWLSKTLINLGAEVCGYSLEHLPEPSLFKAINLQREITDIRGDVRDKNNLQKALLDFQPQIVFHLAAQPIVLESYNDPVNTFDTNVTGTVNLLNILRPIKSTKVIIVMTSDKSYRNNEWLYPYRETDILGGKDPYSASKSCQDIVVESFRESYFKKSNVSISAVRAGNIIGGGDFGDRRIIPDLVRGITQNKSVSLRNPNSVRPWQYVLEPIYGMMILTERMWNDLGYSGSWNFGPRLNGGRTVIDLTRKFIELWGKGKYHVEQSTQEKEANYLTLDISKAIELLNWSPIYDFQTSVLKTVEWYKAYYDNNNMSSFMGKQIYDYIFDHKPR
ncbi:MAG: CDP-glucose 4,6-dehydratase [Thermoplasmatales archaeon]